MADEHLCDACSAGCTARRTDEKTAEEISAGPYLLVAAITVILFSLALRWLF
ncbi:MAG TPA: hypothetical protein VMC85_11025 [Desulfomonilaceae bacterium]|nr:hypothetical protein [Desulfomonilaceae bacterium]